MRMPPTQVRRTLQQLEPQEVLLGGSILLSVDRPGRTRLVGCLVAQRAGALVHCPR